MQNKISSISAELEKDRCNGVQINSELSDTEKSTSQFLFESITEEEIITYLLQRK